MSDGSSKIPEGVIQSGKIDPDDPLYVHTLITFALKKIGMSQEEADTYAAAHQQHALDAASEAITDEAWPHERPERENEELYRLGEKVRNLKVRH